MSNPTQPDRFEDRTREDETYLLEQERERLERAAEKSSLTPYELIDLCDRAEPRKRLGESDG